VEAMKSKGLPNKRIIISTHVYTTGPSQDLKKFLTDSKIEKLLFIGHPLFYNKVLKGSGFEKYCKGEKEKEYYSNLIKLPFVVSCFKDFFIKIYWGLRYGRGSDLYIGSNNLNALSGIVLRSLHVVKRTVTYVIDYNPKRFENRLLNYIFHKIDHFCVILCDETWNLSDRMKDGRKKYFNFEGGNQKTVPMGAWVNRIKPLPFEKTEKHTLVFMGHVTKKQGVQNVINAVPDIIKKIPDFRFLVLGGGPFLERLKEMVSELGVLRYIDFSGFVEDSVEVERKLSRCALAIALYEKYDDKGDLSFTYFADPGKIKLYLACGLPVLLSDVPYNALEIQNKKCGLIISEEKEMIANAVIELMSNQEKLKMYKENAYLYSKNFDWDRIFGSLF
jgi:glycosyltransferase involved in cell wall biosynthesis